jgi:hypothetical protein
MEMMRHEAYKITQWMDWIKASVFALITLRQSSKGSLVRNRAAKELKGVDGSSGLGCKGFSGVPIEKLFSCVFFKNAEVSNKLFVSKFI